MILYTEQEIAEFFFQRSSCIDVEEMTVPKVIETIRRYRALQVDNGFEFGKETTGKISIVLTKPLAGLDLPDELVLGPFDSVSYDSGWFYGDGEQVAEVFRETMNDMMSNALGHPAAGAIFAPRTFDSDESGEPEYPGKGYKHVVIKKVTA